MVTGLLRSEGCGRRCLEDGGIGRLGGARRGCLGIYRGPGVPTVRDSGFPVGKL